MKVFISWSGKKSEEIATALKRWIPCVLQNVEPYFSSSDIDKGARWSTDIAKELQVASFGILCVTKENIDSSWLNFEAGALSKSIEQSKVCPLLIDLKPSDIQKSPILQFQMTSTTQEDVRKLFISINNCNDVNKLGDTVFETTFNTFWPRIEEDFKRIISNPTDGVKENKKEPSTGDLNSAIEEILELTRYQFRLLRSPTELLPVDYLTNIISKASSVEFLPNYDELKELLLLINRAAEEYSKYLILAADGSGASLALDEQKIRIDKILAYSEKALMFVMPRRRVRRGFSTEQGIVG